MSSPRADWYGDCSNRRVQLSHSYGSEYGIRCHTNAIAVLAGLNNLRTSRREATTFIDDLLVRARQVDFATYRKPPIAEQAAEEVRINLVFSRRPEAHGL